MTDGAVINPVGQVEKRDPQGSTNRFGNRCKILVTIGLNVMSGTGFNRVRWSWVYIHSVSRDTMLHESLYISIAHIRSIPIGGLIVFLGSAGKSNVFLLLE